MPHTKTEQEAIVLNAVLDMIDGMVNYDMFEKRDNIDSITLMFSTMAHKRLFNILLCDFLSQPQKKGKNPLPFDLPEAPSNARASDLTYLFYLRQICAAPHLNPDASHIIKPLEAFADWLEQECVVDKVWLPSINLELNMRIPRIAFLKICGDIGKHNFSRLEANVTKICRILKDNGHTVSKGKVYLVLPEFYEWFHNNVFSYHSTTIAEFLNNLRWGIFYYLRPEFHRSFERCGPDVMYRFNYPKDCTEPLAQAMYWNLMNMVRSEPYFPAFTVDPYLKKCF